MKGKALDKLLAIMSAAVNIALLLMNAMFFQATYAMANSQSLAIGVYLGWLGGIVVTVVVSVLAGWYFVEKYKAENPEKPNDGADHSGE